jgi:hypothetical protein
MKATIKMIGTLAQIETAHGFLIQLQRSALDQAAAFGWSKDDATGYEIVRNDMDPNGLWIHDRRGNGLRSFAVRVEF